MENNEISIRPISIIKSIWTFLVSFSLIYIGLYVIIPVLLSKEIPFLIGYFIFFYFPFVLLFFMAFVLYKKEGNNWNVQNFKSRLRLKPLKMIDWIWIFGIILSFCVFNVLLTPVANRVAQIPFFSPAEYFPAEINPNKTFISGITWGYNISGQYWVIIVYFIGWFFNIFGEELLWRGIILPRQIEKYGSKAWIYHGIIWGFWHFYWKWNFFTLIPLTLLLSFAVYKRKNTWIGIISHGLLNLIPLIMIIINVFK